MYLDFGHRSERAEPKLTRPTRKALQQGKTGSTAKCFHRYAFNVTI